MRIVINHWEVIYSPSDIRAILHVWYPPTCFPKNWYQSDCLCLISTCDFPTIGIRAIFYIWYQLVTSLEYQLCRQAFLTSLLAFGLKLFEYSWKLISMLQKSNYSKIVDHFKLFQVGLRRKKWVIREDPRRASDWSSTHKFSNFSLENNATFIKLLTLNKNPWVERTFITTFLHHWTRSSLAWTKKHQLYLLITLAQIELETHPYFNPIVSFHHWVEKLKWIFK